MQKKKSPLFLLFKGTYNFLCASIVLDHPWGKKLSILNRLELEESIKERVYNSKPDVNVYHDAIYIPQKDYFDGNFGVFTREGYLIPQSGYYQKFPPELKGQPYWCDPLSYSYQEYIDECIYVGSPSPQFGHFITEFISRLWYCGGDDIHSQLLTHTPLPLEFIFGHKWAADFIALSGLKSEQFLAPKNPVRIKKLIVPSPSFMEDNFAYRIFSDYCNKIGENIKKTEKLFHNEKIYLTRENISCGTVRLIEESFLTQILVEKYNFRIISPENQTLFEQINNFRNNNIVSGILGSAFHSSIFAKEPKFISISLKKNISRNFTLMDYANRSKSEYYSPHEFIDNGPGEGFESNISINDIDKIAYFINKRCDVLKLDN